MQTNKYIINFSPTEQQMAEIYSWTTFPINNWSSIDSSFRNKTLAIAIYENKVIGFIAYKLEGASIYIEIVNTHPNFEKRGIARFLVGKIAELYSHSEYKAFYLFCAPNETQCFWKKLGFDYFPENQLKNRNERIWMFYIFGEVCTIKKYAEIKKGEHFVEIWNSELNTDSCDPNWYTDIEFHDNTKKLKKPLLFFGDDKWQIRIKAGIYDMTCRYKDYDRTSEVFECFFIDEIK
ncbi:GNAT family N-acetyltransferase [Chryseobacterium salivictor]|uniref:N-acetyltransferase domain-containing protein n=1 Tax=Chryseobacterium salivictor TaxID=2547600 RepID=A0A4P6ZFK4_9FLAO|nr:GNAT family N-acetyltransferase [Chryseobacterium salivictor]QBO58403.1 hypothetical protein NBC122_01588 [Chryseobacterium salivictor]